MAKPPQATNEPPRKSSKVVPLVVLGVLSVMVVGYCAAVSDDDDEVTADCVMLVEDDDATLTPSPSPSPSPGVVTSSPSAGSYVVVDDSYCDDDNRSGTSYYYGGSRGAYVWYYGGNRVGNRVQGGTTLKPSDVTITSRSGKEIQRGGFGRSWTGGS
ncbi:hypothetical protein [Nonomuraea rubra]|uniref:hypothetical protein n=1 Tax=Nonomuraea rubra TaxID=46180 RepID=UPI0034078C8C